MPDKGMIVEDAFAKINLALHVTGQRDDGYHLLDMLVTFARHGDRLEFSTADKDSFEMSGRFGAALGDAGADNLVIRARDRLRDAVLQAGADAPPVHIHLQKKLPIASGIGGGSADAAATLRGLSRLWNISLPASVLDEIALGLGADVPMCLHSTPLIARGIGELIEPVADMPQFAMVLANPLKGVSTPEVFRRLGTKTNPPLSTGRAAHWLDTIRLMRNDLEPPARALLPEIGEISAMLAEQGADLVRMSGSGATCFGLFQSFELAEAAAVMLHRQRPDWYFQATETIPGENMDGEEHGRS
ncbi:4-(cytidine 5'-diphospho)-2-C-methyl-D-erythritol kinase [Rhizobium sp. S152]|uniref:4-(cytidine 5'-diphospho)-2-C-methyl-D-erythritol kinase n=1 Tax=Rhizobium sp. S152 TaxID=3055038 RepID=UPI0025A96681|nr:4-(cytidine 5'-diphospho)-2-C-methyl-D-erythritol kinase [Rhizobium sp. S152]MDM9626579.1 4-(cytidine 5'-diphospho)-2-C-methyl-D-erythritol kinase [Rhizobium sp. S152]